MRKICLISCSLILLGLIGCGNNTAQTPENKAYINNQTTVAQVLAEQTAQAPKSSAVLEQTATSSTTSQDIQTPLANPDTQTTTPTPTPNTNKTNGDDLLGKSIAGSDNEVNYDKVDVDLSVMSSSLVYSEVANIMAMPDDYCGKVMKMSGLFTAMVDDNDNKTYCACIIQDATACCAQGIEFQPFKQDLAGKDIKNLEGSEITVTGTFGKYTIGDNVYYTLKDARIVVLK